MIINDIETAFTKGSVKQVLFIYFFEKYMIYISTVNWKKKNEISPCLNGIKMSYPVLSQSLDKDTYAYFFCNYSPKLK